MRFEGALMQHFILLLPDLQSFFIAFVTFKFSSYFIFHVISSNSLILDSNAIELALLNESIVLDVSDLSFSSSFELLPCLLLNHCCIGVHVLSLQSDLLEFLCKPSILFLFIFLLLIDLFICFDQAFLTNLFLLLF